MKHHLIVALAAMAWAVPGLQIEARGQADGGRSASHVLVDVEFSGGDAMGYIEALRAASGEVNIVVDSPEAVAGVSMAPVKLSSVQLSAALELLQDREGQSPDGRNVMLTVRTRQVDRGGSRGVYGNPLYQVSCTFYGSIFEDSIEEISGVWTVADLLASEMASADMLTAIETALALFSDGAKPPEMRFHEPTGLLIARGEEEQLEVIDNIIAELRSTVMLRENAQRSRAASKRLEASSGREAEKQAMLLEMRGLEAALAEAAMRAAAQQQEMVELQRQLVRSSDKVVVLQEELQKVTGR